jgi:putative ABC transport system substrate-binding protein
MKRRQLLLLLAGATAQPPLAAIAQQSMPTVGFLFIGNPQRSAWWVEAFRKGMVDAGFVEGRNYGVEYGWAGGDLTRLPALVADLVRRDVAVIVTTSEQGAEAARSATTKIPIVFNFIADPVEKGLVKSFTEPGGNITGVADPDAGSLETKRLQLLHEVMPGVRRIGYLFERQNAERRRVDRERVVAAAKTLGIEITLLTADKVEEIEPALVAARQGGIGAVLVQSPATFLYLQQKRLLEAAARHGLPMASGNVDFAMDGGLFQYSFIRSEVSYLTASYVVRILKGQNAAQLPVQHATKTELVFNLKTAKALGLDFPGAMLGRADQVIE